MLFAIHAVDRPGTTDKRRELLGELRDYLRKGRDQGVRVVMAGPLTSDDGNDFIGSIFLVEAPNRAAAEKYANGTPLQTSGVWDKVQIHGFRRMMG